MLKIRLQRVGRKNNPSFRLVLTDSKNATRSGKYVEALGSFDYRKNVDINIDADRIKHWISKGAQPTDNIYNLLLEKKIISGKKKNVNPKKVVKKEEPKAETKVEKSKAEPTKAETATESPTESPKTEATTVEAVPATPVQA